ncbi:DUF2637 domain-containing protein [Haloglycomyces albus]|uniref:DUF2637 domain-containing protein n=1 Tax=Haloglycomyces albus TaxID=526067 RepID=UPI00046C9CA9|nr:DUF2637 domain-containing protein [Haloglycomyces albus]
MAATPTPASDEPDDNSNTDDELARNLLGTVWCEGCDRSVDECSCERKLRLKFAQPNKDTSSKTSGGEETGEHSDGVEQAHTEQANTTKQRSVSQPNTGRTNTRAEANTHRTPPDRTVGRDWGLILIGLLAGGLALGGFAASFQTVTDSMAGSFEQPWLVPLVVDLGIIVFTLLDIVLARRDMRISWLRYIPWGLTAGTIWLNVAAGGTTEEKVAHAALPAMWVVFSEVVAHVMRRQTREDRDTTVEPIPLMRWVCAPWATIKLWRSMKLWDIRRYRTALEREEQRQQSRAVIVDHWGSVRRAPRRLRVSYRQHKITVEHVLQAAADSGQRTPAPVRSNTSEHDSSTRSNTPSPSRSASSTRSTRSNKQNGSKRSPVRSKASTSQKLSEAYAALTAEGASNPTVRDLADRAGVSSSTAWQWKNRLDKTKNTSTKPDTGKE